jgi:predicted nucleotidyltransferase
MDKSTLQSITDYLKLKPVISAWIFGSYAREEASLESDIDILVELDYESKIDLFDFIKMNYELSDLLHKKIDLISTKSLSPFIKPAVDKDKVLIYAR